MRNTISKSIAYQTISSEHAPIENAMNCSEWEWETAWLSFSSHSYHRHDVTGIGHIRTHTDLWQCIHCGSIVLSHWETRPPAPWTDILLDQSHYPDTEPTSPCPIIIMPSTRLGSEKYQFIGLKKLWSGFESVTFRFPDLPEQEAGTLLIRPPRLVATAACVFLFYNYD